MPMLIPNHQSVPKSIANISKNGIDIDAVVRSSFSHAVKNSLSKFSKSSVQCIVRGGYSKTQENTLKNTSTVVCVNKNNKVKEIKTPLTPCNKNYDSSKQHRSLSQLHAKMQDEKIILNSKNIKKENRDTGKSGCQTMNDLDDSLTSLQWLTGVKVNDLMEGKPISYTPLSPAPSNCSDEGDDKKPNRTLRYHSDSSVDYRTNSHVKPPYSYAALIIMAMKSKSCSKMTLSEIYRWITDNFVYYKHAEPSWQNSIRHNLSLNKCFAKIPRNKGDPGKGGYWSIVPEYADKLLESNIRKRRSSMLDYGCQEFIKRQKLDLFESQLLLKIKEEINSPTSETAPVDLNNNKNDTSNLPNDNNNNQYKVIYKHSPSNQQQSTATLADAEHCRMDHPYGKNPLFKFISEEDNIKAIADSLQRSSHSFVDPNATTSSSINFDLSNSHLFNTFSNAIRTDCIWSSEQNMSTTSDLLAESMSMVKEELMEARNLTDNCENNTLLSKGLAGSLNSSGGFTATFCLSPPLSGDDDTLSDDLNDDTPPFEDLDLTVRGTSMTLLHPTPEMIEAQDVKEEPLSPESIDLYDNVEE